MRFLVAAACLHLACAASPAQPEAEQPPADAPAALTQSTGEPATVATKPASVPKPVPAPKPAPASERPPPCEVSKIRACFGPMQTIAGTGGARQRDLNSWRSEFEGAAATTVELSRPHFVMADDSGAIFVADRGAHAIRRIGPGGTITTVAGTGVAGDDGDKPGPARSRRLVTPNGLWVRGDGTFYILDLGNGVIRRVSTSGEMTTLFRVRGGISIGRGLWVSDDETRALVSSGSRLLEWTKGRGLRTFARGFRSLGNLAVDPEGHVVVTDRAAGRVYRLDARGGKTVIAGNGQRRGGGAGRPAVDSSLRGVRAVWFDKDAGMFLGTHESDRVWYVGADGVLQEFLGRPQVEEVRGLSLDRHGNLLVVDHDHGFVRRFERKR